MGTAMYLVQDDARQLPLANAPLENTLDSEKPGFIGSIVLGELVRVFESACGYRREQITDAPHRLFEVDRFQLEDAELGWRALDAHRNGIDFSDAPTALANERAGCEYTASFDRRAARLPQVRVPG